MNCVLPDYIPLLIDAEPQQIPTAKEAEMRLIVMPCLYRVLDGQYWAYQFCYGKEVTQFHPTAPNAVNKGDQFSLGSAEKISSSSVKERRLDGGLQLYLEQVWQGGSVWY